MLSRRSLLKSATATAVAAALSRRTFAGGLESSPVPLRQLDYSAVTLLPGPLQEQFAYHHQLLLGLSNDKLLKPLRQGAGQAAPGEDMGGWYSESALFDPHGAFEGFVPGHSFGQFVSALARSAAITNDAATREKVSLLVAGAAPTLNDRLFAGYPLPSYFFDKICCGLIDAYSFASVENARPLLEHTLSTALPHMPEKALSRAEQRARPYVNERQTWDESYTVPENLFLAYTRLQESTAFRDAAVRFLEDDLLFNPLSEDIDVLQGEHAYSHVNAMSSAMQAYLVLGSQKHLRAAQNAFRILEAQSFATGGWGPGEALLRPNTDDLGRSVLVQPASFETPCGSYAHFKLTRYLLRVTGDPHYGDSMERVLYNTVLGAKPILPDGSAFYYSDFTLSGHKTYHRDKWPCCSGTLPQVAADYGISTYLGGVPGQGGVATPQGLTVVLFVPSRVRFEHAGSPITLTQETSYPAQLSTMLTLAMTKDATFPLAIRVPGWAGAGSRVDVNDKMFAKDLKPGTFVRIERTWRSGDKVEIAFETGLRTETLKVRRAQSGSGAPEVSAPLTSADGANTDVLAGRGPIPPTVLAALLRGPVVFMATGAWPMTMRERDLLSAEVASAGDRLTVRSDGEPILFVPYTTIKDEAYRTYQPLRPA